MLRVCSPAPLCLCDLSSNGQADGQWPVARSNRTTRTLAPQERPPGAMSMEPTMEQRSERECAFTGADPAVTEDVE
nr:hypothetical protein CFP56_70421 [Quercus suber]